MRLNRDGEIFLLMCEFSFSKPPQAGDPVHNAVLRRMVVLYGYIYEHDKNALWCWRAYVTARALGDPIPEWALCYFDRAGAAVWKMGNAIWNETGDASLDLPTAMEMKRRDGPRHGRGTILRAGGNVSWLIMALSVLYRMLEGDKEGIAIEAVAKEGQLSDSTIRRAWKKYKTIFPYDAEVVRKSDTF